MQTLLIDILKYTRLKYNDDSSERIDLRDLLEEISLEISETIAEKNVSIIVDDNLPAIDGISFLLTQLFSNLINNSIKYSAPGKKPEIKITAAEELQHFSANDPELYQVIYVADNGIGFEQQYAQSIFNIFTRLHSDPDSKGSGVGLALCKKIMQNHNGHISASSSVDAGTTISLYFPTEKVVFF
jgi:signal transduction histidine kinase